MATLNNYYCSRIQFSYKLVREIYVPQKIANLLSLFSVIFLVFVLGGSRSEKMIKMQIINNY